MADLTVPVPEPHPLRGDSFTNQYSRASFLAHLFGDYAKTARSLIDGVMAREVPHHGSDAEALLSIIAARDIERMAESVAKTPLMQGTFSDIISGQLGTFRANNPNLKQARDVVEHIDEYMASNGWRKDHWFDITKRFGEADFVFRIGNELDLDMIRLINDAVELADVTQKSVAAWFQIELLMQRGVQLARVAIAATEGSDDLPSAPARSSEGSLSDEDS